MQPLTRSDINYTFGLSDPLINLIRNLFGYDIELRLRSIESTLVKLENSVSQLSDAIAAATVSVDAAIARVQEDVASLNAKITELEAKIVAGGTPEDFAALDALRARLDALDPVKPDVLPEPTPEPV